MNIKLLSPVLRTTAVIVFVLVSLFAVSQTKSAVGRGEITPTLLFAYYPQAIEPIGEGTIIVGDLQTGNLNEILPNTFRINGTIVPTAINLLPNYPGFTGPVYELKYSLTTFIEWYLPFYDSSLHDFMVTAVCDDMDDFQFPGQVMLRGHATGDVNRDGRLNITDLSFLTGFMFRSGTAPADMTAADVNHDGSVNVADVIQLVRKLFVS